MPPRPEAHWLRIYWKSCLVVGEWNVFPCLGSIMKSSRKFWVMAYLVEDGSLLWKVGAREEFDRVDCGI